MLEKNSCTLNKIYHDSPEIRDSVLIKTRHPTHETPVQFVPATAVFKYTVSPKRFNENITTQCSVVTVYII